MRSFSIAKNTKLAPEVHPHINQGCMQDVTTASAYRLGIHGESILNGGKAPVEGICGQNNNYKSAFAIARDLQSINVMTLSSGQMFDVENTATMTRVENQQVAYENLRDIDLVTTGAYTITNGTKYSGDEYHLHMKAYCSEKQDLKEAEATTPFMGRDGKQIKCKIPSHFLIDSFSGMNINSVTDMIDKHALGESGHNMSYAKESNAKTVFMRTVGDMMARSAGYITLTAHVDKEVKLDPYAPTVHKLNFMKKGMQLKNVSNKYAYMTNNLWYCYDATPMTQPDKTPVYPSSRKASRSKDSKDLMIVTTENLRGKFGPSGVPFGLIYSQTRGLKRALSEYHYLKTNKAIANGYFGMIGSQQKQQLCLYPDIVIQRTTAYDLTDSCRGIRNALRYTSELAQLKEIWQSYEGPELDVEPQELYDDLTKLGYDVKWLMDNARPYYTLVEEESQHQGYYLSTMDLLRMRLGKYYPYWYDEAIKEHGLKEIENRDVALKYVEELIKAYTQKAA